MTDPYTHTFRINPRPLPTTVNVLAIDHRIAANGFMQWAATIRATREWMARFRSPRRARGERIHTRRLKAARRRAGTR